MAGIVLHDLTLGYAGHAAIHHLSGEFTKGTLTAVVGPNGSGKSTLLKGLAGVLSVMGGHIHFEGSSAKDVAYLPQANALDLNFPATVRDLVQLGLWRKRGMFKSFGADDAKCIAAAIKAVGLSGFEHRALGTLSGGQMQRAIFARTLVQDAQVILLDEPFAAIDSKTTTDLMQLIADWHKDGRSVIAVLHDTDFALRHFPQCLLLAREAIAWGASKEVLTAQHLAMARLRHEAWDEQAPDCEKPEAA